MSNKRADDGKVFVCLTCGRTSKWKYGFDLAGESADADGNLYTSWGWDENCVMNSEEVEVSRLRFGSDCRVMAISDPQ